MQIIRPSQRANQNELIPQLFPSPAQREKAAGRVLILVVYLVPWKGKLRRFSRTQMQ